MKIFLASIVSIIFTTSIFATVEDAKKLAEEQILVFKLHMQRCEDEGFDNGLVHDYAYHSGYIHGACEAYINMLKKIDQD